jgi:hypothetical protein
VRVPHTPHTTLSRSRRRICERDYRRWRDSRQISRGTTVAVITGTRELLGGVRMTRTIGAAIGAIIVFLFFVLGITHPRLAPESADTVTTSVRR